VGTFAQNFEGFSAGAVLTSGASGGQSPIANVQGTVTVSDTTPLTGDKSAEVTLTTGTQYMRFDNAGATGRTGILFKFRYPGTPAISASLFSGRNNDSTEVGVFGAQVFTTGVIQIIRTNSGSVITESRCPTGLLVPGNDYWLSAFYLPGGSATTARLGYRLYAADGSTVLHEWAPATDYDVGITGSATRYRLGLMLSTQWVSSVFKVDEVYGGDLASGAWWTPPTVDPTLTVTATDSYTYDARTSTSGGGGSLTYSVSYLSGANHLSEILEPIDGLFIIPKDTTTSSAYRITVTEGLRTDTQDVTVPSAVAPVFVPDSIRRRIRVGGSWL